jgi:predicted NACHT family NTPase
VTGGWGETGSETETAEAQNHAPKTRAVPAVWCTLCSLAIVHRCIVSLCEGAQQKDTQGILIRAGKGCQHLGQCQRALLLFDGLDEVLDTSYRQEISGDIAMFAHLYPSVPMLVTSREVGYEQAPLDEAMFEIYRLLPFDDEQVREFMSKWFSSAGKEDFVAQSDRETETFLKESESTIDLRTNPLLLSLLCSIYGGYRYLPRNRADIYERSAEMFLSTWDKSRSIIPPLLIDQMYLRLLIEYLAYWIYEDGRLQAGVAEEELVAKATEYLYSTLTLYGDRAEAERVARASIEYLRGRAWILAEIGTGEDGRRLYQFIHRGFLEYFAAAHLVRTNSSPIDLLAVLVPHIANREWDALAELAWFPFCKAEHSKVDVDINSTFCYEVSAHRNLKSVR